MLLDERAAIARALPSLPLGLGGDKTAAPEAMAEQLRDPGGIFAIGFASRHGLAVLRIDHQQCKLAFEQIGDGAPVHAGAFHGDMGAPFLREPSGQGQQVGRHRPEGSHLLEGLWSLSTRHEACRDGLFVDVEATAAGIHHVHQTPPEVKTPHGILVSCRISPACFLDEERQTVVPPSIQALLLAG